MTNAMFPRTVHSSAAVSRELPDGGDMDPATNGPLRIAIVSTPRSGNTWIRLMLSRIYGIPELAVHQLDDAGFRELPAECILQLHAQRTPEFAATLARHRFRPLVLVRHPLDVLISILHYAVFDGRTDGWLMGSTGDETGIYGATPRSDAFLAYAAGPRAASLLGITGGWWHSANAAATTLPASGSDLDRTLGMLGTLRLRYEDAVADPVRAMSELVARLGPPRVESPVEAAQATRLDRLRPQAANHHFWQGKPGHWRRFFTVAETARLAAALAPVTEPFGYQLDADPDLTPDAADANWVSCFGSELRTALGELVASRLERPALVQAARERDEARQHLERLDRDLSTAVKEKSKLAAGADALRETLVATQLELLKISADRDDGWNTATELKTRMVEQWTLAQSLREELNHSIGEVESFRVQLARTKAKQAAASVRLKHIAGELRSVQAELAPYAGLGPFPTKVAWWLQRVISWFVRPKPNGVAPDRRGFEPPSTDSREHAESTRGRHGRDRAGVRSAEAPDADAAAPRVRGRRHAAGRRPRQPESARGHLLVGDGHR
jgi:hypothetical protein